VWDYVTDFHHYLLPFPNQRVRRENIRFFIRHNVKGIFEQDTYESPHSEMAALGGYLTAKFLWNPDYDENTAIDEFLAGYYGKAAGPIRKYLDALHDRAERENIHVHIGAPPTSTHLTNELLTQADALWEQAQKLAADQPEVLDRVRLSRMSVDYAIAERARLEAAKKDGDASFVALAVRRFKPFVETLASSGLTNLREGERLNLDDCRSTLAKGLKIGP
jgi:hypothetical protein